MSQGRFSGLGVVLLAVITTGCGSQTGKWKSFPIEIYADAKILASPEQESDLKDAMAFWEAKAGKKLFDYRGEGATVTAGTLANIVQFLSPWPFGSEVAGRTTTMVGEDGMVRSGIVLMNPETNFCTGRCDDWVQVGTSFRNTLTHELGHFIGLRHNTDQLNIMHPIVLSVHELNEVKVDLDELGKIVGD